MKWFVQEAERRLDLAALTERHGEPPPFLLCSQCEFSDSNIAPVSVGTFVGSTCMEGLVGTWVLYLLTH
jgi:hypothetical protein